MTASINSLHSARIVILGAGPTGLGAAHRLQELGISNFVVYEKESYAGGLAASFGDDRGFTWDIGGHVQFSHYGYFDRLMDSLLPGEWLEHERESWIWILERFVPYPFQNNIRNLPKPEMLECLKGLIRVATGPNCHQPANFEDWIQASFGEGIARHFLLPYNFKVWAWPPREMAYHWVGERVAKVDLERVVTNIIEERDDASWGPNNTFRFPKQGGTGEIWRRLACRVASHLQLGKAVVSVNPDKREIAFSDGTTDGYDLLISTIPIDLLVRASGLEHLNGAAAALRHSTVHIAGVGLKGAPPPHLKTKCWMYFPENTSPFYRATVFSNYSPNNVPDAREYWSLMLEVSESPVKAVSRENLMESIVDGLLATRLIESRADIVDTWQFRAGHGYPTPSLERDRALAAIQPELESRSIFSRGRFGAWKYEVSNQDHSLMQGVELIDRLAGEGEEETFNRPGFVNSRPKC